jgi:hypothetical protein
MQVLLITVITMLAGASQAFTPTETARPPELNCDVGPLHKTYGETAWLVYACNDSRSIVIISDEGNPAFPFLFMLYVKPSGDMQLHGEGDGKESATRAAFDEIKTLTQSDVAGLVEQAQSAQTNNVTK